MESTPGPHPRHTQNVVAPRADPFRGQVLNVKFEIPSELLGSNQQLPIWPRGNRDLGIEANGRGEDETIVVVSVLADEIHASGCAKYCWGSAKDLFKVLCDFWLFHH